MNEYDCPICGNYSLYLYRNEPLKKFTINDEEVVVCDDCFPIVKDCTKLEKLLIKRISQLNSRVYHEIENLKDYNRRDYD